MSDTRASAIVIAWLETMPGRPRPPVHDSLALMDAIDAAISLHAQHAWTTAARQMRDECASALRRCSRPAEADMVADVPLPLPPRATPLVADAGAQPTDAAIEQARREGAEAMRTRCFEFLVEQAETLWVLHTQRGQTDQVARIKMGALQEQADQLFALPLPGDAS